MHIMYCIAQPYRSPSLKSPIKVVVTGAAGQIAYSLIYQVDVRNNPLSRCVLELETVLR